MQSCLHCVRAALGFEQSAPRKGPWQEGDNVAALDGEDGVMPDDVDGDNVVVEVDPEDGCCGWLFGCCGLLDG